MPLRKNDHQSRPSETIRHALRPSNDAFAPAGASFSLSPLSRKCAPKVVPLVPFWEVFGHQNRIKSAKEAFKKIIGKSMCFPMPLGSNNV